MHRNRGWSSTARPAPARPCWRWRRRGAATPPGAASCCCASTGRSPCGWASRRRAWPRPRTVARAHAARRRHPRGRARTRARDDSHFWDVELPQRAWDGLVEHPAGYDELIVDEAQDVVPRSLPRRPRRQRHAAACARAAGACSATSATRPSTATLSIWTPSARRTAAGVPCSSCSRTAATPRPSPLWPAPAPASARTRRCCAPTTTSRRRCASTATPRSSASCSARPSTSWPPPASPDRRSPCSAPTATRAARRRRSPSRRGATGSRRSCTIGPLGPVVELHSGRTCYASVHRFKGLEARAVVLTDVERLETDRERDLFYVGATRARQRLVVLAHESLRRRLLRERARVAPRTARGAARLQAPRVLPTPRAQLPPRGGR